MTEPEQVIGFIGAPDSGKTTIVNEVKAETEEPYQIQPPGRVPVPGLLGWRTLLRRPGGR